MNDKRGPLRHQEFGQVGGHPCARPGQHRGVATRSLPGNRQPARLPGRPGLVVASAAGHLRRAADPGPPGRRSDGSGSRAPGGHHAARGHRLSARERLRSSGRPGGGPLPRIREAGRVSPYRNTWDWVNATLALRTPRDRVARLVVELMASPTLLWSTAARTPSADGSISTGRHDTTAVGAPRPTAAIATGCAVTTPGRPEALDEMTRSEERVVKPSRAQPGWTAPMASAGQPPIDGERLLVGLVQTGFVGRGRGRRIAQLP